MMRTTDIAGPAEQKEKDMRSFRWPARALVACGALALVGCVMESGTALDKEPEGTSMPVVRFVNGLAGMLGDGVAASGGHGNTNDNGGNTNDNGADNTNDNSAGNTNDNGAGNTNDNGAGNANDNGGNTNQNDNGSGTICPDGTFRVDTDLEAGDGSGDGDMQYRVLPGGCKRFRARVDEGLAEGTYEVAINNVVVGHIVIDSRGRGELEFDSEDGTFPADFPDVAIGEVGDVGGILFGTFALDCPQTPQTCNANDNGNDNGAGNTNDNGAPGNTNDNVAP